MITKELQNLSDKLTGGHTSAHEISKQVDYIEKNYEGVGVLVLNVIGDMNMDDDAYLDQTWNTIYNAFVAGKKVIVHRSSGPNPSVSEYMTVPSLCAKTDQPGAAEDSYSVDVLSTGGPQISSVRFSTTDPEKKPAINGTGR